MVVVVVVHEETTGQRTKLRSNFFNTGVHICDRFTDVQIDCLCATTCDFANAGNNVTVDRVVITDISIHVHFTGEQRAEFDDVFTRIEVFEDIVTIRVSRGRGNNCTSRCVNQINTNTRTSHVTSIVDGVVVVVHEHTTRDRRITCVNKLNTSVKVSHVLARGQIKATCCCATWIDSHIAVDGVVATNVRVDECFAVNLSYLNAETGTGSDALKQIVAVCICRCTCDFANAGLEQDDFNAFLRHVASVLDRVVVVVHEDSTGNRSQLRSRCLKEHQIVDRTGTVQCQVNLCNTKYTNVDRLNATVSIGRNSNFFDQLAVFIQKANVAAFFCVKDVHA